jgi:hypothetical protein
MTRANARLPFVGLPTRQFWAAVIAAVLRLVGIAVAFMTSH